MFARQEVVLQHTRSQLEDMCVYTYVVCAQHIKYLKLYALNRIYFSITKILLSEFVRHLLKKKNYL